MSESGVKFHQPLQLMWKTTFLELPLTVISESLRFVGQRLEAQSQLFATLNRCHSVPEFIETQSEFSRKAFSDYGAGAGKILDSFRNTAAKAA
jgi:hypothetical protein